MITKIQFNKKYYTINLANPLDISIPIQGEGSNVTVWYVGPPKIFPHEEEGFVGKVSEGAYINFNDIEFNPHSHGSHTECMGHLTTEFNSVNQVWDRFFFMAELVTIAPEKQDSDFIISKKQLQYALGNKRREALIIRTLPNMPEKKSRQYSHTNPPYLLKEATEFLVERGIQHLLIDLPSVDRERDEGLLVSHRAFWGMDTGKIRKNATITELVYVDNTIADGQFFLNLQVAPFENDASPSRPVLYKVE